MESVVTIQHLIIATGTAFGVVVAVIAAWPVRRIARVEERVFDRLSAQDERISTTLTSVHAALDELRRNQENIQTLNANVFDLRSELAMARRHPLDQHPKTEVALAQINDRLDHIDDKLDEVVGIRYRRARNKPGAN